MNNILTSDIYVRYMDSFFSMKTNIITILYYFNEIAQQAGDYYAGNKEIRGSDAYQREEEFVWMLTNWQIEVDRYPDCGETLKIKTVARAIDRYYAFREFFLMDSKEFVIAQGKSKWVLLDPVSKKPMIAKEYMNDLYGVARPSKPFTIEEPFSSKEPNFERDFEVEKSDIDLYHHVNNIVYAKWIYDSIPFENTERKHLKEFRIRYKKECNFPDKIVLYTTIDDKTPFTTTHQIRSERKGLLALASSTWTQPAESHSRIG